MKRAAACLVTFLMVMGSFPPLGWCPEEVKHEVNLSVTGYYRLRGFWINEQGNPFSAGQSASGTPKFNTDTEFWDMRLMLNPDLKVTDNIHVKAQFRILDDFIFGHNTAPVMAAPRSSILRRGRARFRSPNLIRMR